MRLNLHCLRLVLLTLQQTLEYGLYPFTKDEKELHKVLDEVTFEPTNNNPYEYDFLVYEGISLDTLYAHEKLKSFKQEDICYAISQLIDANYLESSIPLQDTRSHLNYNITRITFLGNELLEHIMNPVIWSESIRTMKKFDCHSITTLTAVSKAITRKHIQQQIGITL